MKRILILGVCALFIACSNSTEKTSDTDTSSVVVPDKTAVISDKDTTSVTTDTEGITAPETAPKTAVQPAAPKKEQKSPEVTEQPKAPAAEKPVAADNSADVKKGEMLVAKSDCFACHKTQEKLLGPSYKEVANKYPNTKANVDYLVAKIKNGGSGVWGAIPMSPHPTLSDEDAKAMVQYVLSLK